MVGEMRADPNLNLVYILNETDHRILALNTDTGEVDVSATVDDSVVDGFLEFSLDGSVLHVSTPATNRIHSFSTGTLAPLGSVSVAVSAHSFVVGSDGCFYTIRPGNDLVKINPNTGAVDAVLNNSGFVHESLLIRNPTGTRIFAMKSNSSISGSEKVHEISVVTGAAPQYVASYFGNRGGLDLCFDETRNVLYRPVESTVNGLEVWNINTAEYSVLAFGHAVLGHRAVAQLPGTGEVVGAARAGPIRRFDTVTGATIADYGYLGEEAHFFLERGLEITPNGHMVYAAGSFSFPNRLIGLIGHDSIALPSSLGLPKLPQWEVMTSWTVGDILGDPSRNLVYIVDETNLKLLAFNSGTGQVMSEANIPVSPADGTLSLSPDNATLYLSSPATSRMLSYSAGPAPALTGNVVLANAPGSFEVGSDGFLYFLFNRDLHKVDPSNGTSAGFLDDVAGTSWSSSTIRRDASGDRVFVMDFKNSSSGNVLEFLITPGSLPSPSGTHFLSGNQETGLSVDLSRNKLYRTGGLGRSVNSWDVVTGIENFLPSKFRGTVYALAQHSSSSSILTFNGVESITEIDKDSGKIVRFYPDPDVAQPQEIYGYDLYKNRLEVGSDGHAVYHKYEGNGAPHILGVIGPEAVEIPRSSPMRVRNLSATMGAFPNRILLNWNESPGATTYEIYREITSSPGDYPGSSPVATSSTTNWEDPVVFPDHDVYYWIRAVNEHGKSLVSSREYGFAGTPPPPAPPSGLSATDGTVTGAIDLAWAGPETASSYSVYRNSTNNSATASLVAQGVLEERWRDTATPPGVTFYYWVKSVNVAGGSDFSVHVTGSAKAIPAVPQNVSATDGTEAGQVTVTWAASARAETYKVYRNSVNNPSTAASMVGGLTSTSWTDTSTAPGTVYYYWVKASHPGGDSSFSASNPGNSYPPPAAPTGVNATDGTHVDKVTVTWNSTTNTDSYEVYRHSTNNPASATLLIEDLTGTSWDDTTAATGFVYYYWVKAANIGGSSSFSLSNSGHVAGPPPASTGVSATDGAFPDRVVVTWDPNPEATTYQVLRNTSNNSTSAETVASMIAGTTYTDSTVTPSVVYYYWIGKRGQGTISGLDASRSPGNPSPCPAKSASSMKVPFTTSWPEGTAVTGSSPRPKGPMKNSF